MIRAKRVYEEPAATDGCRILVDRIWPRGLAKKSAAIDIWLKEAAPSTSLRKWFGHRPERWLEFKQRYFRELKSPEAETALAEIRAKGRVDATLLFAARDEHHNNAVALMEYLRLGK